MADRRGELIREEDAGWAELHSLLDKLSFEDMERIGVTPEWTVKDLVGHLASWWAEAASQLERISMGTYTSEKLDVDALRFRVCLVQHWFDLLSGDAPGLTRKRVAHNPEVNAMVAQAVRTTGRGDGLDQAA